MDWLARIDAYCERTDFSYWSEPVNAVTNAAFLVAALVMWPRVRGLTGGRVLAAILFAIGIGSYLFHTHATAWAATADVLPILAFILVYLFLVNRDVAGWPPVVAAIGTAGFVPYAAGLTLLLRDLPFFGVSSFYWSVPVLLVLYGFWLRRRVPATVRGFVIGAAILALSISLRSVDEAWCENLPLGTHFLWHVLNAVMLGWMIEVYRRHMLEGGAGRG
ncbi:MAG: Alkaline phytoceramidase (aPHC) [Rhodobacteraceae bacterium HLUCCA08]|nr:MAG: Alkaline phytoceramidase (aPHC) [Rhodobacteraceae bacterium HLUCCA08]